MIATVSSVACDGCAICPAALSGACLWICAVDEYLDSAVNTCKACPSCGDDHLSNWDGCIHDVNCSLCDDPHCKTC